MSNLKDTNGSKETEILLHPSLCEKWINCISLYEFWHAFNRIMEFMLIHWLLCSWRMILLYYYILCFIWTVRNVLCLMFSIQHYNAFTRSERIKIENEPRKNCINLYCVRYNGIFDLKKSYLLLCSMFHICICRYQLFRVHSVLKVEKWISLFIYSHRHFFRCSFSRLFPIENILRSPRCFTFLV